MTTRRGFLASLGLATLAVALDVLPALGQPCPTFEAPVEICGYFSIAELYRDMAGDLPKALARYRRCANSETWR